MAVKFFRQSSLPGRIVPVLFLASLALVGSAAPAVAR